MMDCNFDDWFAAQEARKLKCGCIDSCLNRTTHEIVAFDKYKDYHKAKYDKYKVLNGHYWADDFVSQKNRLKCIEKLYQSNCIYIKQVYRPCKETFEDCYGVYSSRQADCYGVYSSKSRQADIFLKGLKNYDDSLPFDSTEPYLTSYNEEYIEFCIDNDLIDASTEQIYRRFYLKGLEYHSHYPSFHYPSFQNIVETLKKNNLLIDPR